jgi:cytochrome c biogenesis protein CcdA
MMDWVRGLLSGAGTAFDQAGAGPVAIPLAFALGLLSAIVSACCTLPVLSIVVGYAGTRTDRGLRARLVSAGIFVLGAALALMILGGVAAAVGQVAQTTLGRYWKLVAGMFAIILGLGAMNLLPFNPFGASRKVRVDKPGAGWLGVLLFGLVGGGAVSVCSLACNPGIFIILGAAMLQGFTLWMTGILLAYALGFSLPLGALLLGVSFATAAAKFKSVEVWVRRVAGIVLMAVGFYFLWTF